MMTDKMTLADAVKLVMERTGMTEDQAKRDLLRKMQAGDLPVFAQNVETGRVKRIPRKLFGPKQN